LPDLPPGGDGALLLAAGTRAGDGDVDEVQAARLVRAGDVCGVLPPFAAALLEAEDTLVAVTDPIGMRHLYHRAGDGWAAVSTSARALACLAPTELDRTALAVQSLLGWQLGTRTLFEGVTKVPAGCVVRLARGIAAVELAGGGEEPRRRSLDEAVREATALLRHYLEAYLDEHPDAVLQLTGGQDSRILLSAVPARRRGSLRAMTLAVPGSGDAGTAARISARYGLRHDVVPLRGLDEVSPAEAVARCSAAAARLDAMADPVAFAVLDHAERRMEQGHRLSGLGGEVARGFYYLGRPRPVPVTERRSARLAAWRMFANEAAGADALDPGFASWARGVATREVHRALAGTGRDWPAATDEFYLYQRMQRWAGVVDSAVCFDRVIVNPMLDPRFIDVARGLAPRDKYNALFLGRLQAELDPELAAIPLEGRPPPSAYARPSPGSRARIAATRGRRLAAKAGQRLRGARRPPAGGPVLAQAVVEGWREDPGPLHELAGLDVVRSDWIEAVVSGDREVPVSTVAFVTNLVVARRSITG
jgi:asparagine synthase (glutamine-hydrolysing)